MVGRQSGHPQAGPRTGAWPSSWPQLAGGAGALADRALALLQAEAPDRDPADAGLPGSPQDPAEGALRLAGHLAELAWLAAPDDPGVQEARRTVFTRRADAAIVHHGPRGVLVGRPGVRRRERRSHRLSPAVGRSWAPR